MRRIAYDIETFKCIFTAVFKDMDTGERHIFEVSERINQSREFCAFLWNLARAGDVETYGYNNEGFDWPACQFLMELGEFNVEVPYLKAQQIITGDRFENMVWPNDRHVKQVDLFKIHHFDNMARSTSLKALEINMKMHHVEDLPFSPHVESLTYEQHDDVIQYNCHDVDATEQFAGHSEDAINFRRDMSERDGIDMMNFNDTKIGKEYFIRELEEHQPGICFTRQGGRKKPRQTWRSSITLKDVILPIVKFDNPEFQRVLEWMNRTSITETKGVFDNVSATIDDFEFDFGTGGIHGSRPNETFHADDEYEIIDVDVTSYYPSLAIAHRLYPEHLSEAFCDIYERLFKQRQQYPKTAPESKMIKLALNGVYGDSNSKFSPFYDPKYTMSITINGQLLLCMLAEWTITQPGVRIIQINTDGMTVKIHRPVIPWFNEVCRYWETYTGLELEAAHYSSMWVRDVNNYIAKYISGDVKRKGAFEYATQWHQNNSSMIVPKAAEAALIHGVDPVEFIYAHTDPFDFCRRAKVPRTSRLELSTGEVIQNTTRYHIAVDGPSLTKVMPPLAKKPGVERPIGIDKGWGVQVCNDISDFDWTRLDRRWYIKEAKKLIDSVN